MIYKKFRYFILINRRENIICKDEHTNRQILAGPTYKIAHHILDGPIILQSILYSILSTLKLCRFCIFSNLFFKNFYNVLNVEVMVEVIFKTFSPIIVWLMFQK